MSAWAAQNNELVLVGSGGDYLRSEKLYGNFTLSLEYKLAKGGNSGIGLRTARAAWPSGDGMERIRAYSAFPLDWDEDGDLDLVVGTNTGRLALDEPPVLAAEQAGYLEEEERVFGVLLGGEARAYPLRILDWHEVLNDTVGGLPVSLSYCTLCGSGILYSTRTPSGGRYTFDTSGLLYRSNKLMVERDSRSLWSNLTGLPVVGELARTEIRLEMLPMTLTTWREWRRRHPRTTVLDLDGIRADLAGRFNFDYRPGAADLARSGVSFPVWRKSGLLDRDERIFALRVAGRPKAYPLTTLYRLGVINDQVGGAAIVLVADEESGSVRAYRSEQLAFEGGSISGVLVDGEGRDWRVGEAALVPTAEGLESLPRVAGHVALWFGWYGFYPQTEVYGETE